MNFSGGNNNNSGRSMSWSKKQQNTQVGGGSFLKIFKSWKREASDSTSHEEGDAAKSSGRQYFDISELEAITKFTRHEIRFIYRDFKQV